MNFALVVVPWSEHKLVILFLIFHDGLDASVGLRVEDMEFEESHLMMVM